MKYIKITTLVTFLITLCEHIHEAFLKNGQSLELVLVYLFYSSGENGV
jgi:hypothetical protein